MKNQKASAKRHKKVRFLNYLHLAHKTKFKKQKHVSRRYDRHTMHGTVTTNSVYLVNQKVTTIIYWKKLFHNPKISTHKKYISYNLMQKILTNGNDGLMHNVILDKIQVGANQANGRQTNQ